MQPQQDGTMVVLTVNFSQVLFEPNDEQTQDFKKDQTILQVFMNDEFVKNIKPSEFKNKFDNISSS